MTSLRSCILASILLAVAAADVRAEPVLLSVEGAGALALTAPQSDRFGPGVMAAAGVYYPLAPAFLLGARWRVGFLGDGAAPRKAGLQNPGVGTLESLTLALRVRPLAGDEGVRRATGLFLDAAGGGGLTGDLARATFEAGVGYGFGFDAFSLAPTLRYVQVTQPAQALAGADARLLMLGAEFTFLDPRPAPAEKLAAVADHEPPDLDKDGIADVHDACADQPEDLDGNDDADGCPELDNDGDKIVDANDKCPDAPEDFDEYDDVDGCPDHDNDQDSFLDADDQCPNEAEIVNGNKDFDGCPDEGLIEFKNDRIVLEERVLFDFERARVKREARPILRAIVNLKAQHPEWIKLRIEGHADAQGDARFNQDVSERRANNVLRELVKLGIPASQIESVGYGATRLRDKRGEEEANARNRRVEFVVMARGVAAAGVETVAPGPSDGTDDAAAGDEAGDKITDAPPTPASTTPPVKP